MATPNIQKHAHHLAVLTRGKADESRRVLRDASDSLHDALADVARMVLVGKLKLAPQQVNVRRHIAAIRKLAHPRTTKTERADMLRPQQVGFMGFLAPLLGAIEAPLLGNLFK